MSLKHFVRSQDLDITRLTGLIERTDEIIAQSSNLSQREPLRKNTTEIMAMLFYEPSTRTRFSFHFAALHLGMQVVTTENAKEFSSAIKGETLEDTIRVVCEYEPRVVILRHNEEGAAARAAETVDKYNYPVSIVNAGDGGGQHPTQALLDLYSIHRFTGKTDGLTVVIGGDLKNGRTARSLAYLLSKFSGNRLVFVAPQGLEVRDDIVGHLREHNTTFLQTNCLEDVLPEADVVYWTRVQRERGSEGETMVLDKDTLKLMKDGACILHPLPRADSIAKSVDDDSRARYFKQAGLGKFVRVALLEMLLGNEL